MRRPPFLAASLLVAIAASACSSSQVLEPSAIAASPPAPGVLQGEMGGTTAPAGAVAALDPAVAARTRLRFDPIVGATVEAAAPLTERLGQRARARGIAIAGNADGGTTHVLKGYFSTLTEGGQTTVIYVWDVYDPSGNRLHRINGQQKAPPGTGEGWASIPPATMQAIADSTVDQLASWLATSAG